MRERETDTKNETVREKGKERRGTVRALAMRRSLVRVRKKKHTHPHTCIQTQTNTHTHTQTLKHSHTECSAEIYFLLFRILDRASSRNPQELCGGCRDRRPR